MAIRAKWMGQDCEVINFADFTGTTVFLITALPGEVFPDGSIYFTAYRPELTDIQQVSDEQAEALGNWQAAISDTDRLADDDNRPAVAAALSIERMAYAAFVATLS